MTAGFNLRFNIWRMDTASDDYVGGASVTGTVVHYNVRARFEGIPAEQMFTQQGLETRRTFRAVVGPGTLDIRERDEAEVVKPYDHPYLNDRFRINGVTYSNFTPRQHRSYIMLEMTRSVRAHDQQ